MLHSQNEIKVTRVRALCLNCPTLVPASYGVSSASQAGLLKPRGAAGARADEKEVTAVYCCPFCETSLPAGDCRKKLSGDRPKDSPNLETITRAGAISARGNSLHGAILHCSTRRRAASSPEQALSASLSHPQLVLVALRFRPPVTT